MIDADYIDKLEGENQELQFRLAHHLERVERLRKALTTRFARSSPIEEKLMAAGVGKRPLPTAEECLEWAAKLGIPDEFNTFSKCVNEMEKS